MSLDKIHNLVAYGARTGLWSMRVETLLDAVEFLSERGQIPAARLLLDFVKQEKERREQDEQNAQQIEKAACNDASGGA